MRRNPPLLATLLASLLAAAIAPANANPVPPAPPQKVPETVLARVQEELVRLKAQAETEGGLEWPPPSSRVAYLLLAGLAAESQAVEKPSPEEEQTFDLARRGGRTAKLFIVAADTRLVFSTAVVQDKAGSYTTRRWTLYRLREGKWVERGAGTKVGEAEV